MKLTITHAEAVASIRQNVLNYREDVEVEILPVSSTPDSEGKYTVDQMTSLINAVWRTKAACGLDYWKIPAIKEVRLLSRMSLFEAKRFVEAVIDSR